MNRIRISIAITLTLLLTGISIPMTSAATKPKTAGRTSSSIPNTILNGKGAPLSTLGIDGDFYIDTRSLLIYGPKKSKKWPLPQSLQGPVGISGTDGKNGSEGKTISTASSVVGPTGVQGSKGEKGDKGELGSAGASGSSGPAGAKGDAGSAGSQGPAGSSGGGSPGAKGDAGSQGVIGLTGAKGETGTAGSLGLTGAKGDTGDTGTAGSQGVIGLTGAKGDTGTAGSLGTTGAKGETGTAGSLGATGPSNVYVNALPTWTLSTATKRTFSTSSILPKFKLGKSYLYTIYIYGVSDANSAAVSLEILNEDNSAAIYSYGVSSQAGLELDPKMYRYFFTVIGTITPQTADTGISIKIIDDMGVTSTSPMSFSGRMYATLVGSVGTL